MQTVLFHETIFGPIKSRRLGTSLGINLMPNDGKICSFNCLYCEAGFNEQGAGTTGVPSQKMVKTMLKHKLESMQATGETLDVLTFSGNGEPTLHPHFAEIVHDVMLLRDRYFPQAKVSVLTNATTAGRPQVANALRQVDNNIVKLDSAIARTMLLLNRPSSPQVLPEGIIADLKAFDGKCVVQTMLLRGEYDGHRIDNTTDAEIEALINAYREIHPTEVMIYSIDRKTPAENLEKVPLNELQTIAERMEREAGVKVVAF